MAHHTRRTTCAEIIREHRSDPNRDTDGCGLDDIELRKLTGARKGNKFGIYTPGRGRWKRPGMIGILDMTAIHNGLIKTGTPKVVEPGTVTRSVNYPSEALNAALQQWYDCHGRPTEDSGYRSQDESLDGFLLSSNQSEDTEDNDDEPGMWDDVDRDWVDYMRIRDSKTKDPETVHDEQTGLRDFRDATQADVNPDSISQSDARLASLPAFLDDDQFESVSKYTPGTGGPLQCDHCNEEDWHSHPLESGLDALRPGGIAHGDPNHDVCHADYIKGCDCCGCPRCNVRSIEFRKKSQDYRCNGCDLKFSHPVPRQSKGERACLYWRCGECGMATQAAFAGVPEDLLDAAPQHAFDG
jgi:hypothetical protein